MAERRGLIRLALFGAPVRHSLSPDIHRGFAGQAGLAIDYRAIETGPGALAEALAEFAQGGGRGCNITLPLKREAMLLAGTCSERVRLAGAANTLTRAGDGWSADNTDGTGLARDLAAWGGAPLAGLRVAVLGAGGATAGVLAALLAERPHEVVVFNRTRSRALDLAERHAGLGSVLGRGLEDLERAGPFDLLINATSLGHAGGIPPLAAAHFAGHGRCYDLNYGPAASPLRAWCEERGIDYRDGLGMLVEQAAESFAIWTGFRPDTAPVLAEMRDRVGT